MPIRRHTPESRAKIEAASTARWNNPEWKASTLEKMRATRTPEWLEKVRAGCSAENRMQRMLASAEKMKARAAELARAN